MEQYVDLARRILESGEDSDDRTGTGKRSIFGAQLRFDLSDAFPLVTVKRTYYHGAFVEMLWMLRGGTSIDWLNQHGVNIWNEWADEDGNLGPIYGSQWRSWGLGTLEGSFGYANDQLAALLDGLVRRPHSRRHILSAWNVDDLPDEDYTPLENVRVGRMALAPCHMTVQFYVSPTGRLSAQVYQRSADIFLGLPFNIAGYALLIHLIAHRLGFEPGELVWTGGDCHLYHNHLAQAREMLSRVGLPGTARLVMRHSPDVPLSEIEPGDLDVDGYVCHPTIKAPVAV